jgi:hypothetical protein
MSLSSTKCHCTPMPRSRDGGWAGDRREDGRAGHDESIRDSGPRVHSMWTLTYIGIGLVPCRPLPLRTVHHDGLWQQPQAAAAAACSSAATRCSSTARGFSSLD